MLVSNFRVEDDSTPYVFSMPPQLDNEGHDVAAYVSVRPFGRTAVTLPSTCQSMRRSLGDRLLLVGIIASTGIRQSDLKVQVSKPPFERISQELDLGIAFSVEAMTETINHALTTSGLPTFQGMC